MSYKRTPMKACVMQCCCVQFANIRHKLKQRRELSHTRHIQCCSDAAKRILCDSWTIHSQWEPLKRVTMTWARCGAETPFFKQYLDLCQLHWGSENLARGFILPQTCPLWSLAAAAIRDQRARKYMTGDDFVKLMVFYDCRRPTVFIYFCRTKDQIILRDFCFFGFFHGVPDPYESPKELDIHLRWSATCIFCGDWYREFPSKWIG